MALILMRHPAPAVAAGVCYGATDVALADPVCASAYAGLPPFDRLVSSPLRRCAALALALGAARGVRAAFDDGLREIDFGTWESRAWDDIPRGEIEAWAADFMHARPHGGESVAMLAARVETTLARYRSQGGVTLVITHAGVMRAALRDWRAAIGFGAWMTLEQGDDRDAGQ